MLRKYHATMSHVNRCTTVKKSLKIFCNGLLTHDVDRKTLEAMTLSYVTSLLADILHHKNPD
jgi:hypothetical protein